MNYTKNALHVLHVHNNSIYPLTDNLYYRIVLLYCIIVLYYRNYN